MYWVGAAGDAQDAGVGTDFHAVASDWVSSTPLQIDLTQYGQLDRVRGWLAEPAGDGQPPVAETAGAGR